MTKSLMLAAPVEEFFNLSSAYRTRITQAQYLFHDQTLELARREIQTPRAPIAEPVENVPIKCLIVKSHLERLGLQQQLLLGNKKLAGIGNLFNLYHNQDNVPAQCNEISINADGYYVRVEYILFLEDIFISKSRGRVIPTLKNEGRDASEMTHWIAVPRKYDEVLENNVAIAYV